MHHHGSETFFWWFTINHDFDCVLSLCRHRWNWTRYFFQLDNVLSNYEKPSKGCSQNSPRALFGFWNCWLLKFYVKHSWIFIHLMLKNIQFSCTRALNKWSIFFELWLKNDTYCDTVCRHILHIINQLLTCTKNTLSKQCLAMKMIAPFVFLNR